MNKTNLLKTFVAGATMVAGLVFAGTASADTSCPHVYGVSCPSGNISIDKKVRHPQSGEFIDALSSSDATYLPEQEVKFRIEVKNTGGQDLFDVKVEDTLPDFVDFLGGTGDFDSNSKILRWTIDKLTPNESKFFEIRVKVKNAKDLPNLSINCVTNFVRASKDNMSASDTSTFCIQTKILGVTQVLPKTGPTHTEAALLGSILSAGLAIVLAKKSVR
ncbi:MAG: hypothetical protein ACD_31C00008G0016 [uncultured bacterium]|uniref:DUF11 domain-containing protein n=2 Tax=Candidatus Daviesiibacteriota TaxID=1752718 RepID=A0A0G0H7R8_9BACT|nr:MAG: hypothetical protein ACD_31C00008G0016 [uncultured bacterium]KKQ08109.1 MAG: hypothetical protein US19_C0031G0009 [Candidatus Daviesbacteria bacterium GW2011_GWB1_36_5]KKQ16419.1 MAG: hypothetical protein US28_C0001G0009 [Candidatus Daviesbacteria bacterium GW2011_GWA1_36_8]